MLINLYRVSRCSVRPTALQSVEQIAGESHPFSPKKDVHCKKGSFGTLIP